MVSVNRGVLMSKPAGFEDVEKVRQTCTLTGRITLSLFMAALENLRENLEVGTSFAENYARLEDIFSEIDGKLMNIADRLKGD